MPFDCEDAKKNYGIKKSGYLIMDVDGPEGPLDPYYAYCDMTYRHVGVTVIKSTG